MSVQDLTDDDIIANGLSIIREGIVHGNWQLICDGYKLITLEELPVPKAEVKNTKFNLDKIRSKVKNTQKVKKPKKTNKIVKDDLDDDTELEDNFQKGGKNFGRGKIQIISVPKDEEEIKTNLMLSKKKIKNTTKRKAFKPSYNENSDIRYKDINKPPSEFFAAKEE